ncbi:MAG: hypothetical protein KC493_02090 [Bacteriovoracaceae bacterium]|nr:hypothetical protein [Bacteriovoracaceae bacterium]
MKLLVLCLFLLSSPLSFSKERELSKSEKIKIHEIIHELIQSTHTSLDVPKLKIKLHTINNPAYFFESNFGAARAILGKKNYRIGVNPLVFDKSIPDDALKGVLAHELIHTEDYASGNTFNTLIPIGFAVLRKKSKIQYERKSDLKVILKGLHQELLAYKKWQYPLLSASDLKTKKLEYLSPKEIELILLIKKSHPEVLNDWFNYKIPTNIDGVLLSKSKADNQFDNDKFKLLFEKKKYRNKRNKRFVLKLKAKSEPMSECTLKAIPYRKKGYDFTQEKIFFIKELSNKAYSKINLKFSKRMKSVDFILSGCKNNTDVFFLKGGS